MFALANLLNTLGLILNIVISVLYWLIIIRALLSWVNPDPYNPIVQFIYKTTEPFLRPFRKIIPGYNIGLDLSPILAILFLLFLRYFLVKTLFDLAVRVG